MEGIKESEGKLDYELDFDFIKAMAERMASNKGKYPPYNWMKPMDVDKLKQAYFRHTMEIMNGRYEDDEREFGHVEAAACGLMMIHYQLTSKNNIEEEEEFEPLDLEDDTTRRKIALLLHYDHLLGDITTELLEKISDLGGNCFKYGTQEHRVLTTYEANRRWEEDLDMYLDDIILPNLDKPYWQFFDQVAWKKDYKQWGRAHSISEYDGREDEEIVNGISYFIYRTA